MHVLNVKTTTHWAPPSLRIYDVIGQSTNHKLACLRTCKHVLELRRVLEYATPKNYSTNFLLVQHSIYGIGIFFGRRSNFVADIHYGSFTKYISELLQTTYKFI